MNKNVLDIFVIFLVFVTSHSVEKRLSKLIISVEYYPKSAQLLRKNT